MKKSTFRRLTATCVVSTVVAAGALVSAPANAATPSSPAPAALPEAQITALTSGIDDSQNIFNGQTALEAGATAQNVSQFAAGYLAGGGQIKNAVADPTQTILMRNVSIKACKGKNSYDVTGLQANLYINSCKSAEVQKGLLAGAAMATLVASVTAATGGGAAAGGVAAAGLSLGAAVIAFKDKGKGVQFWVNPVEVGIRGQ